MANILRTVEEPTAADIPTFGPAVASAPQKGQQAATEAVFLALRALSHRALIAIASLADVMLIASAFTLWLLIIAQPTVLQLAGVCAYAIFIFATLLIRRRG